MAVNLQHKTKFMEYNKTLSSETVFREPDREMYAKLLQIYILGISIYISMELPSPEVPPNGEEDDNNNYKPHYDAVLDNIDADVNNDNAEPDLDNAGYDEVQPNDGPVGANSGVDDLENDSTNAGADYPDTNVDVRDNAGSDDDKPYDYTEDAYAYDDPAAHDGNAGNDDQYKDDAGPAYESANDGSEYYEDYGGPGQSKMPDSIEILDRNTPELGFDLSYSEMMKLKMWPDALIPYYIDVFSFSDKVMRDKIRSFLSSVNSLTALNFVELPSPPSNNIRWVFFVNRRGLLGCADHSIRNFTNAGVQQVVLGYHCMSTEGELAEAVLAIAGVPAQHNAPDRDYYIKIKEENIIPEKKFLFEKRSDDEWLFHDLPYDFNSAGHFHSFKHSINGRPTIEVQKETDTAVPIGESKVLTSNDILKIRMLYNFIVKKKLLQAPDCHKLFEPGKKFNQYQPINKIKPRPKPFRYLGESPDAPLEQDDEVDLDKLVSEEDNNTVEDPNINPDALIDTPTDYEVPNDNQDHDYIYDEDYNNTEDAEDYNYNLPRDYENEPVENEKYPNINAPQEEESDNYNPPDFNSHVKAIIMNIHKGEQSYPQIAGNNRIEMLKSPATSVNKKRDMLSLLSDFQTDEEYSKRTPLIKPENAAKLI